MVSASACRWNSSSSSAAVMREDAGRARMDAVRGATGVPDTGVLPGYIRNGFSRELYFYISKSAIIRVEQSCIWGRM